MSRTADQICDAEDMRILKGSVSKRSVHMLIEYPPSNLLVRLFNGSKAALGRLQQEYPELQKRY